MARKLLILCKGHLHISGGPQGYVSLACQPEWVASSSPGAPSGRSPFPFCQENRFKAKCLPLDSFDAVATHEPAEKGQKPDAPVQAEATAPTASACNRLRRMQKITCRYAFCRSHCWNASRYNTIPRREYCK